MTKIQSSNQLQGFNSDGKLLNVEKQGNRTSI